MDIEPQRVCKQRFRCPPGFENDLYDAAETVGGDLQAILVGAFDPTDREPPVCRAHARMGGKARAQKLSAERRREIASQAGKKGGRPRKATLRESPLTAGSSLTPRV